MISKLKFPLCVLFASLCIASSAFADTTAPTVSYIFANQDLTVTPTGATTLNLSAGQSFSVTGSWTSVYTGVGTEFTQTYLAGLSPITGQINLFDPAHQGSAPGNYFSSGSGTYTGTFIAPTVGGIYYIGGGFSEDFQFDTISGQANSANQVSYIINVATTPEPSSLVLLGTGVLGMVGLVKRRLA